VSDPKKFTIVHIEDEASNWRALPRALRNALFDRLDDTARRTLTYRPGDNSFPAVTTITWSQGGVTSEIKYWLLETASVKGISNHIEGEATFVIDVMRPDHTGALVSSLEASLSSIAPFVTNWDEQVRVFTAYGIPETDRVPALRSIKKSATTGIMEFLIDRVLPRPSD
jgi:hypothetical protein